MAWLLRTVPARGTLSPMSIPFTLTKPRLRPFNHLHSIYPLFAFRPLQIHSTLHPPCSLLIPFIHLEFLHSAL